MTPSEIALVRLGFDRIAPMAEAVGVAFYDRLFELDPTLRRLFAADIRPQARHLMMALTLVVQSLHDLSPILARLHRLGQAHVSYGVKEQDFTTVGAALLDTLASGLGEDFTDAARAAWTNAYMTLAGAMMAAMAQAA